MKVRAAKVAKAKTSNLAEFAKRMREQILRKKERIELGMRANIAMREIEKTVEAIEKETYEAFRKTGFDEGGDEARFNLRMHLRALDEVMSRLKKAIIDGDNARKELDQLNKQRGTQ